MGRETGQTGREGIGNYNIPFAALVSPQEQSSQKLFKNKHLNCVDPI